MSTFEKCYLCFILGKKKGSQIKNHAWFFFPPPVILFGLVEDLIFFHKPQYNDIIDFITTRYSEKDEYIEVRTTTYCSKWQLEGITEKNDSVLAFLINIFS